MGDVLQIVAEAAADRQAEQLPTIEPEAHAAGFAFRTVDNNRMSVRPADGALSTGNTAKLNRHSGHRGSSLEMSSIRSTAHRRENHPHGLTCFRALARAALCRVEGYARHAAFVDASGWQGAVDAHAMAQPLMACGALCNRARADHVSNPVARRKIGRASCRERV